MHVLVVYTWPCIEFYHYIKQCKWIFKNVYWLLQIYLTWLRTLCARALPDGWRISTGASRDISAVFALSLQLFYVFSIRFYWCANFSISLCVSPLGFWKPRVSLVLRVHVCDTYVAMCTIIALYWRVLRALFINFPRWLLWVGKIPSTQDLFIYSAIWHYTEKQYEFFYMLYFCPTDDYSLVALS